MANRTVTLTKEEPDRVTISLVEEKILTKKLSLKQLREDRAAYVGQKAEILRRAQVKADETQEKIDEIDAQLAWAAANSIEEAIDPIDNA